MLVGGNVLHGSAATQGVPFTFAAWMGVRLREYIATGRKPAVHVQVQKRGVVLCGRVLEAAPAREGQDSDWFKVDSYLGQSWFTSNNVRQCSGLDGRCHCADVREEAGCPRACAGAPGASLVPPGNTGTTLVEGA